jgi:SNF2 family DNA or RNA helicase
MRVVADIDKDARNDAIGVWFKYDQALVAGIKRINGARFIPKDKGGPYWRLPLNLESCHALRGEFGKALVVGQDLKSWAKREVRMSTELTSLAGAADAELERLPQVLPELATALHPYQRAGVKFLSTDSGLCADQPGLGKTLEAIAAVHEAGLEDGPNLIIAPKTSLDTVWVKELQKWQREPVYLLPDGKQRRLSLLDAFREEVVDTGMSGWLVINPAALRQDYPVIASTEWNVVIIDECHKEGLRNPKSVTAKKMSSLRSMMRMALSGTPMAGKPVQLWGILHWLRPRQFTSKWAWAREWLHMENNGFGTVFCDGRDCSRCDGGILKSKRRDFDQHLTPYVLRRTKAEVVKELPPKQYVDVWLPMGAGQKRQYEAMRDDAIVRMSEDESLTANGVLAEFTRLKQFATARCEIRDDKVVPTPDSNKLEHIYELLSERGITGDADEEGDAQVVIFSQFTEVVDMIDAALNERGIETLKITGKVKGPARKAAQDTFQGDDGPRVMLMNVHAGGVAITLDKADTVIFTDEWWAPDVMEQAEDRVHRVSRIHQVTVYYLRSTGTVEELIMDLVDAKGSLDKSVMDDRRMLMDKLKG